MSFGTELREDIKEVISYGEPIRIKYYTEYKTGEYDDDVTIRQSGVDVWTSGLQQPISSNTYKSEGMLVQQGKLLADDKKLYVLGDVNVSGAAKIKIGMNGSPVTEEYFIVNEGQVNEWNVDGIEIYKKLYLRRLNTGSFIGE